MNRLPRSLIALMVPLSLLGAIYAFVPQPADSLSPSAIAQATQTTDNATDRNTVSPAASTEPMQAPPPQPTTADSSKPIQDDQLTPDQLRDRKRADPKDSLFDALAQPLVTEALKRREEKRKNDPEYSKRVDAKLNEGRVNILLFGYGESHEPPATEKAIIGSHTVVSYNYLTGRADLISLTHDIRGPEIEQALSKRGFKSPAVRIDQAYNTGGFALQRKVLENATGLSMDFQIVFKDLVLQNVVDQVFSGVEVDVPMAFKVYPFYLEGRKYPEGYFPKGAQRLSGTQVIQFIKTVPNTEGTYEKSLEHNQRKHIILDGLLDGLAARRSEASFWLKAAAFMTQQMVTGAVVYDFDPFTLVVKNVNETTIAINKFMAREKSSGFTAPQINSSLYVVDPAHGDGGVQWVAANAAVNPITKRDLEAGIYTSPDVEVPINANPYGDLVSEYWTSVREVVKRTLVTNQP